ncbi:hypothetical protein EV356DRAFT_511909 [Viridothelium virens]|uniref:F-box domain-containing protein n=1 Tax=Viridothelium virens TaxID=1048519 RepID=A0A6A6HHA1_VIRVR|nr:hypothetical protein EV356DRAFT_511909 [Viridothelium virens]
MPSVPSKGFPILRILPCNRKKEPSIFRLPPELRILIYKEYLELEDGDDLFVSNIRFGIIEKRHDHDWTEWSRPTSSPPHRRPAILATSRRVRSEVLPILFGSRTWCFHSQLPALHFLAQIGEGRDYIRSLQFTGIAVGLTTTLLRQCRMESYYLPNLQQIKLCWEPQALAPAKEFQEDFEQKDFVFRGMEDFMRDFVIKPPRWAYDDDYNDDDDDYCIDAVDWAISGQGIYDWFDFLMTINGHLWCTWGKLVFYQSQSAPPYQTMLAESEQERFLRRWKELEPAYLLEYSKW